jgi:Pvc16 N-terminal domain
MAILQSTLDQLRARLEAALQIAVPRAEPWVALTNPVDLDGRAVESTRNKIVMMLVGLQSDPAGGVLSRTNVAAPLRGAAPLHLDALVMLMANFSGSNYPTGLGMLSHTIAYFHENPVLLPDPLPGQPVGNIRLDFVNLDLAQTNELMAMLDLKYLPAAVYRMRGLTFTSEAPPLSEPR